MSFKGKVCIIKSQRLSWTPPAVFATLELKKAGYPLIVFEYQNSGAILPQEGEIPTVVFSPRWFQILPQRLQGTLFAAAVPLFLAWHFVSGKPSALIAHGIVEQCTAWVLAKLFKVPYVIHCHEVFKAGEERGINRLLMRAGFYRKSLQDADLVLFPEPERVRLYRRYYRMTGPTLIVANSPAFQARTGKPDIRTRYQLRPDSTLLLYMGGVGPNNLIEQTIRAVAEHPSIDFLIAGWSHADQNKAYEALAKQLGIGSRVHFIPTVKGRDKWELVAGADIGLALYSDRLLRTRYCSTASNKLMESMAMGIPVVGGGNRFMARWVQENRVGVPVYGQDAKDVSSALKILVDDPALQLELGKNGRQLHETEFHYEAQGKKFIEAFGALVAPPSLPEKISHRRQGAA